MRTIKFRGKTINEGEWLYGMTISHGTIARKRDNLYMEVSEGRWKGVDPETVGQFTGLLDKNGKEIYEGDILCWEGDPDFWPETIEFDEGCFMAKDGYISVPISTIDTRCRVIIGNIHDNPDLLNGK